MMTKKIKLAFIIVGLVVIAGVIFFVGKKVAGHGSLPSSIILQVPFSTQAPLGDWSRNEDCEETSITMANAFLTGTTEDKLPADAAQNAINNLKTWELNNLGYNANTGVDATTQMAEGAFGLQVKQIPNFTEDDLKQELNLHLPILLPLNAQLLTGAHYQNGGPLYHMVVVRGYKGDNFIINDPGTTDGDGNQYPFSVLQNAAADWNQAAQKIDPTRKIALVLSK